ncbi:amidase [Halorussus salinisoli]|uniref:amidase n=1 Tax=Halorussus salinisoli TaxID=2558242 RepID=UPI0010C184AA|nr:amidase [Halorussus salinisoli]
MIHEASLAEIATQLRHGRRNIDSYLDDVRDRVDAVDPRVQALVSESDRWNRLERAVDVLEDSVGDVTTPPPLYGVPVGVKDIVHVDGLPTRAGSELPPDELAGPEATVVTRLRNVGALVLGKTVTTEFAYFEPGPTRNPHALDHTPGGSSSGSAAAIATGMCPLAIGTDTGGSVIRPAAFCGIVGFKPTHGRIPFDGVIPLSASLDHIGLFTQDVPSMRLAASVLCDGWSYHPDPADTPMLGIPDGPYLERASSEGLDAFEAAVERLAEAGYEIERVQALADIETVYDRHETIEACEAALDHHNWFEAYGDRYSESMAALLRKGRRLRIEDLAKSRAGRDAFQERLESRLTAEGIECWITPAAPGPAPAGLDTTGDPSMTRPWTHARLPTVTLPAGRCDGLPVGMQCITAAGQDEQLLAWAEDVAAVVAE